MATINIDGKDYDLDDLNEAAKSQLMSLQFVQGELKRLESQMAVHRTAAQAYSVALKNELEDKE
tara:strand:+ start:323 stop:514 length:192 start_codon:yes stop_codon:yes gene_type:complete